MKIKWFSFVRVLGLALVLVYHFFPSSFPGGFIGVDIFFTFSGYLITILLVEEYRKKREIDYRGFMSRRLLRLYPSIILTVIVSLLLSLFISVDFRVGIQKQVAAVLSFTTNYYEIVTGGNYEAQLFPHLFVHTWSLSIEMTSYILWGGLIFIWSRKVNKQEKTFVSYRFGLMRISLLLAVLSYISMWMTYDNNSKNPSLAYFSTLSHMFPFYIGSFVACLFGVSVTETFKKTVTRPGMKSRAIIGMVIPAAILFILSLVLQFTNKMTYHIGFVGVSLLTSIMIINARILHENTPNSEEPKVIKLLSDLSYQIYLFHWPLFVIFSNLMTNKYMAALMTTILSLLFSGVLYICLHKKTVLAVKNGLRRLIPNHLFYLPLVLLPLVTIGSVGYFTMVKDVPSITSVEETLLLGYQKQDMMSVSKLTKKLVPQQVVEKPKLTNDLKLSDEGTFDVRVSIIGDSVALGAYDSLANLFPSSEIDTAGSRNMLEGLQIFNSWKEEDLLGDYIILALGTNTIDSWKDNLLEIVEGLETSQRLIVVTSFNGQEDSTWGSFQTAEFERTLPSNYPYVTVADWSKVAKKNLNIIGGDKTHIGSNPEAIELYMTMIKESMLEASKKEAHI